VEVASHDTRHEKGTRKGDATCFFLMSHDSGNAECHLTDTGGNVLTFHAFEDAMMDPLPANRQGGLKSFTDAAGNVTEVTDWTTDDKPEEVQRSVTVNSVTTTQSYLYAYVASGDNAGRIESAVVCSKFRTLSTVSLQSTSPRFCYEQNRTCFFWPLAVPGADHQADGPQRQPHLHSLNPRAYSSRRHPASATSAPSASSPRCRAASPSD
jgi:hypothetical protein